MMQSTDMASDPSIRPPHPSAYAILIIPFGAMSGYVSVAMAFLCTRFQLTVKDGALLVASGMFPHVWKFFWAPIADTTLSRKRWYLISCVLCALGITAMSAIPMSPANLHLLQGVIFVANLASTFLGMSVEGLMAHATPPAQRGRVGGWFQAGNLGGSGLGGGAGLWMATHLPSPWMSGAALGVCFLLGSAALVAVPEARAETRTTSLPRAMLGVVGDLWQVIKSRGGMLCAALCVLPINTGAATSVLSQAEVAAKWGVNEDTVSLVNGVLNGVISAFGCLVAGEICARVSSRWVYAAVGLLLAGVSATMAVLPFTGTSYVVLTLVYAFVVGLSYTAFTGFVLDAIGKGAAATKYNAFASLSNAPITYMGLVLAWAQTQWGEKGMLFTDAGAGVLGVCVLGLFASMVMRSKPSESAIA
ncbi:MAG: MFS transporter [Planctomycetes bacterium]|nr:MFS transporter [Planctomycetota bacterium]